MKRLTFCLFFLIVIFIQSLSAQSGGGLPANPKKFNFKKRFIFNCGLAVHPGNNGFLAGSIQLEPRLNLLNKYSDFSAGISLPASAGFEFSSSSIFLEAPALLEFNYGHLATKDFYQAKGFSFGAGYSFYFFDAKLLHGIALSSAVRGWLLGRSVSLRVTLTLPPSQSDEMFVGLRLCTTPGAWIARTKAFNKVSKFTAPYKK